MTTTTARQMVGAEILKLRRKRSTMAWALVLTVGSVITLFGYNAIQHAGDAARYGPAGGSHAFGNAMDLIGIFIGPLAAILIGAEAGAGDLANGVFRDLVVTGRSRPALFAVRLPGALALVFTFTLAAFALAVLGTFTLSGGLPTPSLGVVLEVGAWGLLANGVVCIAAVGLASLTGSRPATITTLIGFELIASPLLLGTSSLGSSRAVLPDAALLHTDPVRNPHAPYVAMSLAVVIAVLVLWPVLAAGLGAWRTNGRDA